ncbi:MAG: hypothetical protein ABSG03_39530 [Bryobacteraceae bacterium]|jgi:hypothetical protein
MLLIRQEQMEALQAHSRRRFEDTAVARVLSRAGGDPASVREAVRAGVQQAWAMGLRKESEILRWLDLMPLLEADSGRNAWAADILADRELTPSLKLRVLEDASA